MTLLVRELFVLVTLCLFPFVSSASLTVGGSTGWNLGHVYPPIDAAVGDSIVFEYNPPHEVSLMSSLTTYTNCDFSGSTLLASSNVGGGIGFANQFTYTVKPTDTTLYFACPVGDHCVSGPLKITVNVQSGTTNTTTVASSTATASTGGGAGASTGGGGSTGLGGSSTAAGATGSNPYNGSFAACIPQTYIIVVLMFLSLVHLIVR